jgi:hypothetical protein
MIVETCPKITSPVSISECNLHTATQLCIMHKPSWLVILGLLVPRQLDGTLGNVIVSTLTVRIIITRKKSRDEESILRVLSRYWA